ncbi:MAG: glycosyltransferase [Desulfobacterales bacterium]|nr:glycosyltransferase [Desulfobacterales bacterium]
MNSPNDITITLLLPVLNEIDGLKATLPYIDRTLFNDILMVDGGSTDGSVMYAKDNDVRVILQRRPGLAFAVIDAIRDDINTDYVVEFSPDGNCMVDQLPELVQKLREGYDLVTVSRYLPPAKSYDDNPVTAFGNWMFTRMIRGLGKYPITDSLTIYKGYKKKIVDMPEFEKLLYGPVFEPLVAGMACLHNLRMFEIPGDEPDRIGGSSKMSVFYNGSCILLMIFRLYFRKLFKKHQTEIAGSSEISIF